MDHQIISFSQNDALWELEKLYKAEIGEDAPESEQKARLAKAITGNRIVFYGALDGSKLIGYF